jgi:NosR/NirI family transcriptional regulator, nitrous oxide reductase regulator
MCNRFAQRRADTRAWLAYISIAAIGIAISFGILAVVLPAPAFAEKGKLRERLTPEVMAVVFPGADRLGPEEGTPPAIAVFKDDKAVAYVFSTLDIVAATGYSTTPFDVIAGVDLDGRITGAKVVFHNENYIVHDRVRQRLLDTFLAREAGRPLRGAPTNLLPPDFVAGATISARAMRAAVLATAALVLRARVAGAAVTVPTLDVDSYSAKSFDELLADGAVVRRRVTSGEVASALTQAGASNPRLEVPLRAKGDDLYIEFMTGLFTPPAIGGNLIGLPKFEDYKRDMPSGSQAIFIASNGPYDILGTKYFRDSEGNRFDRLRIIQNGRTFGFAQGDYTYAAGFRGQQNAGIFALAAGSGFDPVKPWRLELLVHGTGASPATVAFGLDYKVPDALVLLPTESEPEPVADAPWVEAWRDARLNVAILTVLLATLTLIFAFQATLARHRLAHRLVRNGFLVIVLVWLGWTAGAQLSIVHVMNYLMAPFKHFEIGFYLAEPLMIIIAGYTLISLFLIGRGVFCGWLCPFGALQELLGQVSRALRVPQWNPSHALEQRLWMGKYIAAAAVLLLVMTEIDPSGATIEIEPFKTAITSKFTRAWPYLIYAAALLAIGLFSERAYCRFLCPLGGVLAALDRLHLLNLLKRRPECGNPCHLCERSCPVRAIEPSGVIKTSECFQCLDCQVEYYDDKRCPPLVWAAKLGNEAKEAKESKPAAAMVDHA